MTTASLSAPSSPLRKPLGILSNSPLRPNNAHVKAAAQPPLETASAELQENRALLHRVLREKQQLLARCTEQESQLKSARVEAGLYRAEIAALEKRLVAPAAEPPSSSIREEKAREAIEMALVQEELDARARFKEAALQQDCEGSQYNPAKGKLFTDRQADATAEHKEHAYAMSIVDTADADQCEADDILITLGCCECMNQNAP